MRASESLGSWNDVWEVAALKPISTPLTYTARPTPTIATKLQGKQNEATEDGSFSQALTMVRRLVLAAVAYYAVMWMLDDYSRFSVAEAGGYTALM